MPSFEVNSMGSVCRKCGKAYGRQKGNFPVSYGYLYKGVGYIPYCRECIDSMYNMYLAECKDQRLAMRQLCRKLDIYWNDITFDQVLKQSNSRSVVTNYLSRISNVRYSGKSYDDTLIEEGVLWVEPKNYNKIFSNDQHDDSADIPNEVPAEIMSFWGPGYTPAMYMELEQRRKYWMSKYPDGVDMDIGTEAIIRQICSLEIDINKARAAGNPIDKYVNSLNTLLGSANLKPAQNSSQSDATDGVPLGVWIKRFEDKRPIPEPDENLRDVDGIVKCVLTWFYGHIAKTIGVKNIHSKLYDEEIERLRVTRPEYSDEDDDDFMYDIITDVEGSKAAKEGLVGEKDGES